MAPAPPGSEDSAPQDSGRDGKGKKTHSGEDFQRRQPALKTCFMTSVPRERDRREYGWHGLGWVLSSFTE